MRDTTRRDDVTARDRPSLRHNQRMDLPRLFVVTGVMAAGKSSVARALAERFPRSAHVRGDTFRRFVVNGYAAMTPDPSTEAVRDLRLRYRLAAMVADDYVAARSTPRQD